MFNSFSGDTEPTDYNDYGASPYVPFKINNVTIGPVALNDASEKLNNRFWATYWDFSTKDIILDDLSGTTTVIINEAAEVKQISLAFDQNASDTYSWVTNANVLKLRYFDGTADVVLDLGTAQSAVLTMDMKYQPSNSTSDILLFYIRAGAIYYRIQRDSYSIEYPTPVTSDATKLLDSGTRTDYRFQVRWV